MKWRDLRQSDNVTGGAPRPRGRGRAAAGGGLLAVLIASGVIFSDDISALFGLDEPRRNDKDSRTPTYAEDPGAFAAAVLGSTEDVWGAIFAEGAFPRAGSAYPEPTLHLFDGDITTRGCGSVSAEAGPFYCPTTETIYIERNFFRDLAQTFDAPGDFGAAFVIAHEVGHHVQNVSGQLLRAYSVRLTADQRGLNEVSVRLELQADCYAGVWAKRADAAGRILEPGDLEEGLRTAHQIGDDVIMRMIGRPVDETQFTHGSSEQRMRWFSRGFESADPADCDTFGVDYDTL